jgi:hypothetical protein
MLQNVNKVFVGTPYTANTKFTSTTLDGLNLPNGTILQYNIKTGKYNDNTKGAQQICIVTGTAADQAGAVHTIVSKGNVIKPESIQTPTIGFKAFEAPVEDVVKIDFSAIIGAVTGTGVLPSGFNHARFVVRTLYKTVYEIKSQYTKSYETFYIPNETINSLVTRLKNIIMNTEGRRITAEVDATNTGLLILTALPTIDNEGVNSLNEYSRQSIDASVYYTTEFDIFAYNNYYKETGANITKEIGTNGNGYWKVVRDRENRALGYKGILNRTAYPVILPALNVVNKDTITAGTIVYGGYNTFVIEYNNEYLSNDNQYRKNTPLADEIYSDAGTSVETAFLAFITGALGL